MNKEDFKWAKQMLLENYLNYCNQYPEDKIVWEYAFNINLKALYTAYFLSNFVIPKYKNELRGIRTEGLEYKEDYNGFHLSHLDIPERFKIKVLNNCVKPELGLEILKMAFKTKQQTITDLIPSKVNNQIEVTA